MARLLFIENREKTYFWAAIARQLQSDGHDISWLVQNPVFARNLPGKVTRIPFPKRRDLDQGAQVADFPALVTDRGRDYFGSGAAHYRYYAAAVERIIDADQPDMVIGEPTLFHELLAVDICERKGIVFAHPVGERYPANRFAIFSGASQRPLVLSGDTMSDAEAIDIATRIRDGRSMPAYMLDAGRYGSRRARLHWMATRGRVLAGRWMGERYNTPALRTKRTLNRNIAKNLERWRATERVPENPTRTILYPLQQQPENTIDVWGRPDWDQAGIVRRVLDATPSDTLVAVKANPKPYYELSDALLGLAEAEPRVRLLPLAMRMAEAYGHVAGAFTVTGTVGYEAVCGRGRCLSTSHPVIGDHLPAYAAPSVEEAARRVLGDPNAGRGFVEDGARLMQILTARSFPGSISDPISDPGSMSAENISRISHGLRVAIAALRT